MKTTMKVMSILLFALFAFSGVAMATDIDSSAGELKLFEAAHVANTSDVADPIGLSPKVVAKYRTDGTDETDTQWYSIAAIHPGGNKVYGTAQNINNVYSQSHSTGTDVDTSLTKIPASANSAVDWSNNNWLL